MKFSKQRLNAIYDRTSGYCHICWRKLAFSNYAVRNARGAWEVEHSVPRVKGGTDRLSNLYAAHIRCNRQKRHFTTRTARSWNGRTCAPLSSEKRRQARAENALAGAGLGFLLGAPFGPAGAIIGPAIGAMFGHKKNPDHW